MLRVSAKVFLPAVTEPIRNTTTETVSVSPQLAGDMSVNTPSYLPEPNTISPAERIDQQNPKFAHGMRCEYTYEEYE